MPSRLLLESRSGRCLAGLADFQRDVLSIAIVTLLTLLYTFEGGMTAVIWTDVVQTFIYVGGTLVGFFTILHLVPGGWSTIHAAAATAGKFRVFDFTPNFYRTYTFWSGVIGGAFLTTASHGTDQLIVQRLLGRPKRSAIEAGAVEQWRRRVLSVLAVSADRRDAVGLLSHLAAGRSLRQDRPHLSHLHRELHAARDFGHPDRGHSRGRHVEPQRGAEFPFVYDHR